MDRSPGSYGGLAPAGDITYLELVHRGKAFIDGNMVWVVLALALLVAIHIIVSKVVMKSRDGRVAP